MHILLADPPAYTPPYDHALARALAGAGADVELVTSRFRYGPTPDVEGYRVRETFYPLSVRIGAHRARLAVKALEHPVGLARLAVARPDVVHLQWCGAPEIDAWLLRSRAPLVFTAHDLLPRRTAHRERTWRRLFARFDRIVVHSLNGRRALEDFGVEPAALRVIPHPVFRGPVARDDDGRTALVVGTLRPYKGVPDAVDAVLQVDDARVLVAGDPRMPLDDLRARAGARAEWRLGWLDAQALDRVLAESTVALFPYRAELDQSGALLRALGSGVPAVVYDVGGLGEVVSRYGAGRVVPPGDVDALATALAELLDDPAALSAARSGAEKARHELTWEKASRLHLETYTELVS
jgi:glycosyltransferase involved in cell wall biosynthesis